MRAHVKERYRCSGSWILKYCSISCPTQAKAIVMIAQTPWSERIRPPLIAELSRTIEDPRKDTSFGESGRYFLNSSLLIGVYYPKSLCLASNNALSTVWFLPFSREAT